MAFFECGGVTLLLALPEGTGHDHRSSIIYYGVGDIQSAYQTLKGRGVKFEGRPHVVYRDNTHEYWMTFFLDLDDNMMALSSKVPRAA